jgi:hypothetical protein
MVPWVLIVDPSPVFLFKRLIMIVENPIIKHPQNHHKMGFIKHPKMVDLLLGLPH